MVHQFLRPHRADQLQKIVATDFQNVIDEFLELRRSTDRQMTLENHSVKTRQNPGNETGKLGNERRYWFHGIRFLNDCLVTIILESRMPFFILFYGRWAEPTLRTAFCAVPLSPPAA